MHRLVNVSGSKVITSFDMPSNTVSVLENYLTFSNAFAIPTRTRVTETCLLKLATVYVRSTVHSTILRFYSV